MNAHYARRRLAILGKLGCSIAAALAGGAPAQGSAAAPAPQATAAAMRALAALQTPQAARTPRAATLPALTASIVPVTSCADDGGFDTLRHAVLTANPGDTIDLSALQCSGITLQSGAITIGATDLTISGPADRTFTIDGNHQSRVFVHAGSGQLTLQNLTVANGRRDVDKAYGGCIYAKGSVTLQQAVVTGCVAHGQSIAAGGAIFAQGSLAVTASVLSANTAEVSVGASGVVDAAGGAALAYGELKLTDSLVSGNTAQAPTGKVYGGAFITPSLKVKYSTLTNNKAISAGDMTNFSTGGAAVTDSSVIISQSTIDHNSADLCGALQIKAIGGAAPEIALSTISSNTANLAIGAIESYATTMSIFNSTIAFNDSGSLGGPALALASPATASISSTIIADNTPLDLDGGGEIGGGHDLIKLPGANVTVPGGTVTQDPKLGPLQLNGGTTRTHALPADSPAIDVGIADTLKVDQRGSTYRRTAGTAPDIGAYELDADHIFGGVFETH